MSAGSAKQGRGANTGPRRPRRNAEWQTQLRRGVEQLELGDPDAARACFARAHALAPKQAQPALALGREEWKRGRLVEAERLLRLACELEPGWPLAVAALVRVLIERNARAEAEKWLAPALALEPNHPALLAVTGELHLDAGRADEAEASFEAARAAGAETRLCDAGLARAANLRALALALSSEPELRASAAFVWKRACDLDPTWSTPHVNLGALLHQLERPRAAREHYRLALERDPQNALALFNLGLLCREAGDLEGAGQAFSAALATEPPHPTARLELALTLAERGDHWLALAVELFEEELRVTHRRDPRVFVNLGVAYAQLGQNSRAEAALQEALRIDENHLAALGNLAKLLHQSGRTREAAALVARAEQIGNPDAPPASK